MPAANYLPDVLESTEAERPASEFPRSARPDRRTPVRSPATSVASTSITSCAFARNFMSRAARCGPGDAPASMSGAHSTSLWCSTTHPPLFGFASR
jgi:hypothetical protein